MRKFKYSIIASIILSIALVACGGDNGTSANDDVEKSSSSVTQSSSSVIQSGDSHEGSSNSKRSSSSSSKVSSSSAKATSSSSSAKSVSSSSKRSEGGPSSSSQKTTSSSSVAPASSSSKKVESSSSEYVPFDHKKTLANSSKVGKDAYKQFTDTRNGRSYYYITITSSKTGKSVTVMAENLNIGEMVLGTENQRDDNKIERYCYNNDTTKCDEFGGLYQWAEMMQLPSRCNTESCSDLIQKNHRGICPEGWRLFTWDDYEIVSEYEDKFDDGVKGLRSTYGFRGTNQSGFSLTGAGFRKKNGAFGQIKDATYWFYPEEAEYDVASVALSGYISASVNDIHTRDDVALKVLGQSVRCVKLE
jgi:RhoGEF, Guanine nucleotide exchange factor for Rho/Rac/Cdc42-like GTPases